MLPLERLERIKEHLARNDFASIHSLSEMLGVSAATVRRSLKQLEHERVVNLTRGGAVFAKSSGLTEHPYMLKRHMNVDEKRRIAREAMNYVKKEQSIFLDSSSTVFEMTRFLSAVPEILIVTNDVLIAAELTNAEAGTVTVIGGTLRKGYYTLTGDFAETAINDVGLHFTFLGIDAISLEGGLMITNSEEVRIKRKVIGASSEVIVLCDHTKFEQQSFLRICDLNKVDRIITGKELDDETYQKYIERDIEVIRA